MASERTELVKRMHARRIGETHPVHFQKDYNEAALTLYRDCPQWEKTARAMAYAITHQDIYVEAEDGIGGRVYHYGDIAPVTQEAEALDFLTEPTERFAQAHPETRQLQEMQLIGGPNRGHIAWFWDRILSQGVSGLQERYRQALSEAPDTEAEEFCRGVLILLDALLEFNDRHIGAYEALGNHELAERMKRVPRYPARTFREAVQAFFMQHIVVMSENPFGGNGPGRLDYYLWPYLERDLKSGRCTLAEAREIIDELFLRIDERLHPRDGWVEAVAAGGTYPNGCSAVNPLTYIMIESIIELDITHPSVYVRLPADPPDDLVRLCARYMKSGCNRAQILSDPAIIGALMKQGAPFRDAVEYSCGGCMEVMIQGMTSDFLYCGWQNTAKMLELMVTGGVCLRTGRKVESWQADRGLAAYGDFESFYADFIGEAGRLSELYLRMQDLYSEYAQVRRPSYLISSLLDGCMERGRNMHAGGVKYHDYGVTPLALPNVADGLYAIRRAVFEDKLCTAQELTDAMKADFEGYERLRAQLRALPKYGVDNDDVDALAARVVADFADLYHRYKNRWGGHGKPIILTFVYSPLAAAVLGATPDGRHAGGGVAHGLTPHSQSMTEGITAAVKSCGKLPFEVLNGGASTMWDFDSAWASEPLIEAVIRAFLDQGGQIFQGNTTSVEELLEAKKRPADFPNLIVRVGGYSARFVTLSEGLQDDIIGRYRHSR